MKKIEKLFLIILVIISILISILEIKKKTKNNENLEFKGCEEYSESKTTPGIDAKALIKKFHQYYKEHVGCENVSFLGIHSAQYPADNWAMQELIFRIKPDFIIETGTEKGGTTLFYAIILSQINKDGKDITVDILPQINESSKFDVWKEKVEFIKGDSTSPEVINHISELVKGKKVLITLDSLHTKKHVLKELQLYSPLVSLGSYIVVQDTQYFGHPIIG